MQAYILIEMGEGWSASWKRNVLTSHDKEALEVMAKEHNDKQSSKKMRIQRTYKRVEEIPFI
jgi:hypothetical protein